MAIPKEAFLSTDSPYASIENKNGNLILQIDASCPHNTVLQVTLSAGTVRKQISVRVVKRFTVTFETNTDDVSVALYQDVRYGRQIEEPTVPNRIGYELVGWYTSSYLTEDSLFNFGSDPIVDNVTLYAKWEKVHPTVTYIHSILGKQNDIDIIVYNSILNRPEPPETYGYTFVGFYADKDMIEPFQFGDAVTKDIVIYVKWNINYYTVTFVTDGGTPVDPISVPYNTKIPNPPITTKLVFTFGNWCKDQDGKQVFDFANETITRDITSVRLLDTQCNYRRF